MALSQSVCQSQLEAQFVKSFSQSENIGKLTTDARGENKYDCIDAMGGMVAVNNFLQQTQLNKSEISSTTQHGVPAATSTSSTQTSTQTGATLDWEDQLIDGMLGIGKRILVILLLIIGFAILKTMMERAFRYGYAFFNSHRLIFLKVLLPRGDGKSDREAEKEIAKDMKEKI
ncbi:MAG: hypothetical protein LBG52_07105 [Candidatus Peribacteria bacterium]|jgi:hypothetical protein|nr:hypothetical protein [Candidatus Peribacteria bacterium]